MRRSGLAVALSAAIAVAACSSSKQARSPGAPATTVPGLVSTTAPATSAATTSADELISRARQAALARGWAHLAVQFTAGGHSAAFDQDSGPDAGRQNVTVDGAHATVIFTGGVAYIRGDAAAVVGFFGFPASEQAALTNKWIAVRSSDARYTDTVAGVTLGSALNEISLGGPLTAGAPTTVDGQQVIGVTGALTAADNSGTGTGTLYISAATGLPVQFRATATNGPNGTGSEAVTFTGWGTPVALVAPAPSIADSSLADP